MDQPGDDVRGTKKKAEGEGLQEEAKHARRPVTERRDGMILVFLREQETTRIERHEELTKNGRYYLGSIEESDGKDETAAMFVQIKEDYAQEWLADACDDIDGSELDPACTGVGVVQEDAREREETRDTEEEKRNDLLERAQVGRQTEVLVGQRRQRPVEFTRGDEIQTDCSKSELLCARQKGHHISHRGSNETK